MQLGSPDTPKMVEERIVNVAIAVLDELSVITTDIVLCLLTRLVDTVRTRGRGVSRAEGGACHWRLEDGSRCG